MVAAKTVAAKTVAAKTVAAKTVAAKTVAAKTVAAKTVAAKTVAAKTVAAKTPITKAQEKAAAEMGKRVSQTLPVLREVLQLRAGLRAVVLSLRTKLNDTAYDPDFKALNDSQVKTTTDLAAMVGTVKDYVGYVQGKAVDEQTNAETFLTQILNKELVGPELDGYLTYLQGFVQQGGVIIQDWPPINKSLKETVAVSDFSDATAFTGFSGNRDALDGSVQTLRGPQVVLNTMMALLQEGLNPDLQKFVGDQVPLFYFTDVPRVLKALNPTVAPFDPNDALAGDAAAQARTALVQSRADLAADFAKANDLSSQVRALQEQIRLARQNADDAAKRAVAAQTQLTALSRRQDDLTTKQSKLPAADTTATTDPAVLAARKALQDQADALGAQVTAQQRVVEDATTAQQTAADQQKNLEGQRDTLVASLPTLQSQLGQAQSDVARLRSLSNGLAQEENQAFAEARDNAPFLIARPLPGSQDPARRVFLYGYRDSNTIFIRGLPEDVEWVHDLIASFDRPAPQARLTLYTLQISGEERRGNVFSNNLNTALADVDTRLRNMRGDLTLVQDLLRDSVNAEVNRVEQVTYIATHYAFERKGNTVTYKDRLARYFYYPDEIRREFGYTCTVPEDVEKLASAEYELKLTQDYYQKALDNQTAAEQAKSAQVKTQQEKARNGNLLRANYHRDQACQALNRAGQLRELLYKQYPSIRDSLATVSNLFSENTDPNCVMGLIRQEADDDMFHQWIFSSNTTIQNDLKDMTNCLDTWFQGSAGLPLPDENHKTLAQLLPDSQALAQMAHVTRLTLPDPAHGTTLGEMLFVLSLGKRRSRENILHNFLLELQATYPGAVDKNNAFSTFVSETEAQNPDENAGGGSVSPDQYPHFPQTIFGALRTNVPAEDSNHEMTANQLEITTAIETQVRESVASEIRKLLRQIGELPPGDQLRSAEALFLRRQYLPLIGWLNNKLSDPAEDAPDTGAAEANDQSDSGAAKPSDMDNTNWAQEGYKALEQSRVGSGGAGGGGLFGIIPVEPETTKKSGLAQLNRKSTETAAEYQARMLAYDKLAFQLATLVWKRNSPAQSTPRVAAADDMIKRMITVIEDDLGHYFVDPALEQLRKDVRGQGIQLGILQRESILATNRLIARVDPNANADVQVDGGTDFLGEAAQLGQLAHQFSQEQRAQKAGGSLPLLVGGAANAFSHVMAGPAVGLGLLTSVLGDLAAAPREPQGELYSINSGNVFKVTPVFDPSGQALRFKFDFVATTDVKEPNGTTNRQIPRVEQHSVNTEVQLTNLEFREVSRFESNVQVGTPEERIGGIPLLKELPLIKDIPILGYYAKTGGQNAVRQESLIFAQTSMYPTVSDIVDLLNDEPARTDLEREPPAYLTDDAEVPVNQAGQEDSVPTPGDTVKPPPPVPPSDKVPVVIQNVIAPRFVIIGVAPLAQQTPGKIPNRKPSLKKIHRQSIRAYRQGS